MRQLFQPGQQIETTIVAISGDTVFLDLSLKSEGLMDIKDVTDADGNVTVKVGDPIKVYFVDARGDEFHFTTRLSGGKGKDADNSILENAYKNEIPVEGHVEKEIKGGFEVTIGSARAFCPYSQMGYKNKAEPATYVGRTLTFRITEYKSEGRNILVSNRAICEMEENEKLVKLEQSLTVGMTVKGTVKTIQNYGAFIDVDGFQALLPVSEISHVRVNDINSALKVGQEITAQIIKTDWEHQKMSLSMKALEEDPWTKIAAQFPVGTKIEGTISRVADFGVFVNIAPAVDGLVHVSALKNVERHTNLRKVFKAGTSMSVIVEKIDEQEKRISLSPVVSTEEEDSAAEYLSKQNDDDGETYNPFAALLKK